MHTPVCQDSMHSIYVEGYCPTCHPGKHAELVAQAPEGLPGEPTADPYLRQPTASPQSDPHDSRYSDTY